MLNLGRDETKKLAEMVEAKLAGMVRHYDTNQQRPNLQINTEDESLEGHKRNDSAESYGRKRGLPIEERSALWIEKKQKKLEGKRNLKQNREV